MADRFRGVLESRVVRVDHRLRHNRGHGLVDPAAPQLVAQGLADLIADGTLGVGATAVQRYLVQHLLGQLRAQQDEAHLWSVAVRNEDTVTLGHDVGDVIARLTTGPVLIEDRRVLRIFDQRVTTNSNDDQLLHGSPLSCHVSELRLLGYYPVSRPIQGS